MCENNFEIEILWIAESGYHEGASLKEHVHQTYYQLHYVVEGEGLFCIGGETISLGANMFSLVPPGTSHGIQSVQVSQNGVMRILEVKFIASGEEFLSDLEKISMHCVGTNDLQWLLYQAFLESVQVDVYAKKSASFLFYSWLYRAIRQYKLSSREQSGKLARKQPVTHVKEYLDAHLGEEVSLDAVAELTGYSKNYLCQIFRESTGMTINTYLNAARINKATELLVNTNMELAEIAEKCGYNSVHYFIKTFKKMIGIPPGSYRRSELTGAELVLGEVESVSSTLRVPDIMFTHTNEHVK